MKKMLFCLMAMVATMGLMAHDTPTTTETMGDCIADTAATTTEVVMSTSEAGKAHAHSEGFGRCLKSGCYCKAFEGRGQTCRNCGHEYRKHY
ncbi:MAG: hypothetical protein IJ613_03375 [Muribaculaceae bacterium]|nr:hypothetical protein [Muribaculaceae bacterium]